MLENNLLLQTVIDLQGHGMLLDPPARNTGWRRFIRIPVNRDDNALNCGGMNVSSKHHIGIE